MARRKTAALTAPVPQDDDQARAQIREIGDLERQQTRLQTQLDDKIAKLKQEFGDKAGPLKARLTALETGLQTYCEAHRDRLTRAGKVKSHDFITGEVKWRTKPPRVKLTGVTDVIDRLQTAGFVQFLRQKVEPNKEAMLDDPDLAETIDGISIISGEEEFIVEPSETQLAGVE